MSNEPGKSLYTLQDPTKQYPQPKFKRQTQTAPGSGKKLTPRADHGETSYRGSGRLPNRKAFVTGGDSGIAAPQPSLLRAKAQTSQSTACPAKRQTLKK
jgi:hypothetical protein